MTIYLGLGSNIGERREHLSAAIRALGRHGVGVERISPIVESPALLPPGAPSEWNQPFLNLVVECRASCTPDDLLRNVKAIEIQLGRSSSPRWSPRPIDIDILLWGSEPYSSATLQIPHPDLTKRSFVLAPLAALRPRLTIPDTGRTVLEHARALDEHIPLWMGIVNVTPDSFSDGGEYLEWAAVEAHLDVLWSAGGQLVDFGAESTRPGAAALTPQQEMNRLMPILERTQAKYANQVLKPGISVDTYHVETAAHALQAGATMINDVGGLTEPAMIELAASSDVDWVAMHQLGIPADPGHVMPADKDVCTELTRWLDDRLDTWTRAGMNLDRIVFDPGIGFGKNPLQSMTLLRNIEVFRGYQLRCLVGHSRKSFMRRFTSDETADRDSATLGASLRLCAKGVDILRVHNVPAHAAAYRGWAHAG
jgi:2-amino-4-hydroxy-6-hydroxymethyldihydropteridine diphosphokinase / dihydropteroate synthase